LFSVKPFQYNFGLTLNYFCWNTV